MMLKEFVLYPRSSEESLKSFNPGSHTFTFVLQKTHSKQRTSEDYYSNPLKKIMAGTSLAAEWLGLQASNGRGSGSIPGRGTRSHIPQLSVHMPQLKTLPATTRPGMAK